MVAISKRDKIGNAADFIHSGNAHNFSIDKNPSRDDDHGSDENCKIFQPRFCGDTNATIIRPGRTIHRQRKGIKIGIIQPKRASFFLGEIGDKKKNP